MLSKSTIKFIQSLKLKKYRYQNNKYSIEGEKLVDEALSFKPACIHSIYCTPDWYEKNQGRPQLKKISCTLIKEELLKKISTQHTPNKVLAILEMDKQQNLFESFQLKKAAFFLDGLQDPGNVGTILRIADWFGFNKVLCAPGTVDPYNFKVIQASMGAFFRTDIHFSTLQDFVKQNTAITVYGAQMDGKDVFETQWKFPALLIIGNEGSGLTDEYIPLIDHFVSIKKDTHSAMESLNAGIAAGIMAAVMHRAPNS